MPLKKKIGDGLYMTMVQLIYLCGGPQGYSLICNFEDIPHSCGRVILFVSIKNVRVFM